MNNLIKFKNNTQIIQVFLRNKSRRRPPHHRTVIHKQFPFDKIYYDNDSAGPFKVVVDQLTHYPPGIWGSMTIKDAWSRHKQAVTLQSLPNNTEKYQSMYWSEYNMFYHTIDLPLKFPETLKFFQFITRTKVVDSIPDSIKDNLSTVSAEDIKTASDLLQLQINNYYMQHREFRPKYDTKSRDNQSKEFINVIMDTFVRSLKKDGFYENFTTAPKSKIETFIKRFGYDELNVIEQIKDVEGCIHYYLRGNLEWNLRSRDPLQEFVNKNDPIFNNDGNQFPIYNYHPKMFDLEPKDYHDFRHLPFTHNVMSSDHIRNVPGFWGTNYYKVGDPCCFSVLGVKDTNHSKYLMNELEISRPEILYRHEVSEGLIASFIWSMAQAQNQGFSIYDELHYPICTSMLLTDGINVQMLYYQLNSISSLWKPEDAGLPLNVLWVSPKTQLYKLDANNQITDLNEHAIHHILSSFSLPRTAMTTEELQPYLQEKSARDVETFMVDFDPETATAKESEDHEKLYDRPIVYTDKKVHPNYMFYGSLVTDFEMDEKFREIVPGVDVIPPHAIEKLEKLKLMDMRKKGKKKLPPHPPAWR